VKNNLLLLLLISLVFVWIAGFTIFSFLPKDNSIQTLYPFFKMSYSRVCHQNPLKSFYMNGKYYLVCSRCAGIYFGAFVGLLLCFRSKLNYSASFYNFLIIATIMLFLDVVGNNFILETYCKSSALFTGYLFSFFAVNFVILELKRNNYFHSS